jgi:hypothetical protein
MQALEGDKLYDYFSKALVHIVCAFGAQYLSREHKPKSVAQWNDQRPGSQWAAYARDTVLLEMNNPTVHNLMVGPSKAGPAMC